ncbi:MAG: class I SAM-dependent methyltransferase [Mariprofundus sp.]|nr:class I SAM-dependent methyltransferase [Mariprofundus sp.]
MTDLCDAYVREVLKFRLALNLTSISDAELFYTRFIRPSLAMVEWLPEQGRVLDVGSGMGVPGVPILIAKAGLTGVLVERRKKRAEFLRHVVRKLQLHAEVYDADIMDLPRLNIDVCIARAVADEAQLLNMFSRHVNDGAIAVLPVPRSHAPVSVDGWVLSAEHSVRVGDWDDANQLIRCYRYC